MTLPVPGRPPRVLVIYKSTTLQQYRRRGRRNGRVEELLASGDPDMAQIAAAHEEHVDTVETAREVLKKLGAKATFRNRWTVGDVEGYDLVMTLGGDGTLLWTSHVVGPSVPMMAINSAPSASVGYFAAGDKHDLERVLAAALQGELRATELTRMQIVLDGEPISMRVLNDVLFCHDCPAVTSRYVIRYQGREEEQRSSGVWVGPAAGSTAAIRSAGGVVLPITSQQLQFVVRELYRAWDDVPRTVKGLVEPDDVLKLRSHMRNARLFLDGAHRTFEVDFGSEIEMCRSPEPLTLLGLRDEVRMRA